jgi:hypothetical protein
MNSFNYIEKADLQSFVQMEPKNIGVVIDSIGPTVRLS